jgi:hypothetical protein
MIKGSVRVPTKPAQEQASDGTLRNLFGAEFDALLKRTADKVVAHITKKILADEDLIYQIALTAMRAIPFEKIRGPKGDSIKGDKGDPGAQGDPGEKGDPGKDGADAELTQEQLNVIYAAFLDRAIREGIGSGKDVVDKINALEVKPELQIDAKHIKNLPKADAREGKALHRGGLKLVWNTQLSGLVNGVNTVFTIPAGLPDPKDNRFLVSVRGVSKDTDSGDFTVSNGNRTITFTAAPPNGSARPRIPLYHGK